MTTARAHRTLRILAATTIATVGIFGIAACSSTASDSEPKSATSEKPSTSASPETEAAEPSSGDAKKCTAEQMTTLSSASGVPIPEASLAAASAEFPVPAVIGDLETICVLSFDAGAASGGYAVLSGGAATLTAAAANATAAGAQVTEAAGTFTGSVDGLTVIGLPFSQLTQETAGFENTPDLVAIVATAALG
jgi:hypothetical protein